MTERKEIIETGWNLEKSYASLPKSFFTSQNLNPVSSPKLIILNHHWQHLLGLNVQELQSEDGVAVLAGNKIPRRCFASCSSLRRASIWSFYYVRGRPSILLGETDHYPW